VSATSPNDDPDQSGAAAEAWFPALPSPIDPEKMLILAGISVAVHKGRKGGAATGNGISEDGADSAMQAPDLGGRQVRRTSQWVKSRAEERLVDINVAQPGDEALIEQGVLERSGAGTEPAFEVLHRETAAERLGAHLCSESGWRARKRMDDPPEFALISKSQFESVLEDNREMLEADRRI
jgi:hypothetical protein